MNFFCTCSHIPVHVSDTGGGKPAVVLLHGYLETLSVWDDFVKYLEKDYRILRLDLPGHGLSGTAEVNSTDFTAQVVGEVLQKQGVRECVVGGHSMGGYSALAFAAGYPDAVRGLCLFHSTPHADPPEKQEGRNREIALIREGKLSLAVKQGIPRMFAGDHAARFAEKIKELSEIAEIHEPDGIIACLEGMMRRPDRNAFLASWRKPLLFIFGEKDRYIHPETARELAARYPQAQVLWLKNSGHNGFIEEPEATAEGFLGWAAGCFRQA
ncbi:MAG: alpha/beta hydrolase, partial [Prevotellaceae bacterium]|nr:alpha/beta hydrolase [Prevotellaceae bacterium]